MFKIINIISRFVLYTLCIVIMNALSMHTAQSPKVQDQVVTGLRARQIALTGLIPFLNYTFFVTTENELSHNDTARTSNTSATTLEGGIHMASKIYIHSHSSGYCNNKTCVNHNLLHVVYT